MIRKRGRYYNLWKDQLPDHTEMIQEEATTDEGQEKEPAQTVYTGFPVFGNPMI